MLEPAPLRAKGVDPVVAVRVGGEVRAAVALDAGPVEAVELVVAGGEVLDHDPVGLRDVDPVGSLELAVQDRGVAVLAADGQVRGEDEDALLVDAGRHEHEVARICGVHAGLDGRLVGGNADGGPRLGRDGLAPRADTAAIGREGHVPDGDEPVHADARAAVERAEERIQAGRAVGVLVLVVRLQDRAGEGAVLGDDVVRVSAVVFPLDDRPDLDPDDLRLEEVVEGANHGVLGRLESGGRVQGRRWCAGPSRRTRLRPAHRVPGRRSASRACPPRGRR